MAKKAVASPLPQGFLPDFTLIDLHEADFSISQCVYIVLHKVASHRSFDFVIFTFQANASFHVVPFDRLKSLDAL